MKLTADQRYALYDILRGNTVGEGYYRSTISGDDASDFVSEMVPVIEEWIEDACSQAMSDVMDARPNYPLLLESIRSAALADRKCPCCSGYEEILRLIEDLTNKSGDTE